MIEQNAFQEEDSPDLSDEEIAEALPTEGVADFTNPESAKALVSLSCATCRQPMKVRAQEIRLRRPDLFWRWSYECESSHRTTRTFKVNWMRDGT